MYQNKHYTKWHSKALCHDTVLCWLTSRNFRKTTCENTNRSKTFSSYFSVPLFIAPEFCRFDYFYEISSHELSQIHFILQLGNTAEYYLKNPGILTHQDLLEEYGASQQLLNGMLEDKGELLLDSSLILIFTMNPFTVVTEICQSTVDTIHLILTTLCHSTYIFHLEILVSSTGILWRQLWNSEYYNICGISSQAGWLAASQGEGVS